MRKSWTPNTLSADRSGVAIILVLWVVMVLSLLISGFAFTMHVETQVASYGRKELKAEMLARSGVEVARMELMLHQQSPTNSQFDASNQEWATNELLYVDHKLGDGTYNVKVTDEESKIPINFIAAAPQGDLVLKRLLSILGVDPFDGDVIIDSILDWIDADDLTRLNGAESDYYQSLSPPYRAKNAPIDRVAEMLLIRGVTPELYYGTATADQEARPSFPELFTTWPTGRINVNTASSIVLQAMLNLDDQRAQAIISQRDGPDGIPGTEDDQPYPTVAAFPATQEQAQTQTQPQPQTQLASLISVNSSFFTVKSTGEVGGVKRTLVVTLHRDPWPGTNMQVVAWCELRGGQ
ncbi:MAG TPA: type II secretion system minor pseudopilin GspK [Verrucomicrobiae bacterium]|nr:type II secretion system minor pseudopilin GspK [Verrucomicrobiae bacterium]